MVQAAIDLSAATGLSLEGSIKNLGKTFAGLTGELGESIPALRSLTAEQLKSGAAVQLILDRFGGSALAQVQTFSGAIEQTSNIFGDLQETIGQLIIENDAVIAVIKQVGIEFFNLNKEITGNKEAASSFVTDGLILLIVTAEEVVSITQGMYQALLFLQAGFVGTQEVISRFTDALTFGMTEAGKRADESAKEMQKILDKIVEIDTGEGFLSGTADSLERIRLKASEAAAGLGDLGEKERQLAEERNARADEEAAKERERELKEIEALQERINLELQLNDAQSQAEIDSLQKKLQAKTAILNRQSDDELKILVKQKQLEENVIKKREENERAQRAITTEAQRASLNEIAGLSNSSNKEIAAAGKATSSGMAIADTYEGAQKAFNAFAEIPVIGPVLGAAAATAAITAGLSRVAKINGIPLATGMTEIPAGFEGDTFQARLNSGERVVDRGTNEDLKGFLSGGGNRDVLVAILAMLSRRQVISINGREIIAVVQDELDNGRELSFG